MTIYIKFDTQEQAIDALTEAGYTMSEYNDHFQGDGWGALFQIPNPNSFDTNGEPVVGVSPVYDGWFANIYDCEDASILEQYQVPEPVTPYNVRA